MGACFNQLMENESKESLAQMVCDGFDKIATLEAELAQARAENERLKEIGNKGCDCSPEEACRFAAERDAYANRMQELERKLEASVEFLKKLPDKVFSGTAKISGRLQREGQEIIEKAKGAHE